MADPRSLARRAGELVDERIPHELTVIIRICRRLGPDYRALPDIQLPLRHRQLGAVAGGRPRRALIAHGLALAAEASRRHVGMAVFEEQLLGAAALATGRVADMATGEGKTLATGLAASVHALRGRGVHVMTANDYLAVRDPADLAPLYRALGLTAAAITTRSSAAERRAAYGCDVTYGTVTEFGFDYLRDQLVTHPAQRVQRGHHAVVVDEADAVLIDDASTPLVIAGPPGPLDARWAYRLADLVPTLTPGSDYAGLVGERQVDYTDAGWLRLGEAFGLGARAWERPEFLAAAQNALTAYLFYERGRDYLVRDQQIVLIDSNTGRALPGRRLTDGLHQALEAKERLPVRGEPVTISSISVQRYLREYAVVGGITGTAMTEAVELYRVYGLAVVRIPRHRPNQRRDLPDLLYPTMVARSAAVVDDIAAAHRVGRPVLVRVVSVAAGEEISARLERIGIEHAVLSAAQDADEARTVARAGRWGAVTVATDVAGRGTDIRLGGDPADRARHRLVGEGLGPRDAAWQVAWPVLVRAEQRTAEAEATRIRAVGGLLALAVGRSPFRRADAQLAGRTGRQGDPGTTRFLLSAEDDMLLDNAAAALRRILEGIPGGTSWPLTGTVVQRLVEQAQEVAEDRAFTARWRMMRHDEILGHQYASVLRSRDQLLTGDLHRLLPRLAELVDPDSPDVHVRLGEVLSQLPVEELRARLVGVIDRAWSGQFDRLLTLQTASQLASWSRTDSVEEFRRAAIAAYRDWHRDVQCALLREALRPDARCVTCPS